MKAIFTRLFCMRRDDGVGARLILSFEICSIELLQHESLLMLSGRGNENLHFASRVLDSRVSI
jgi:hypothetical protein